MTNTPGGPPREPAPAPEPVPEPELEPEPAPAPEPGPESARTPDTRPGHMDAPHRGPRAGRGEVRARISRAAREEFVTRGYDGTTLRSVARRAGCDPALVSYYFGSKQRLFRECLNLPLDPAEELLKVLTPGVEGVGERLVRHALSLYDERLTGDTMLVLMRALITDAQTGQRFRSYFRHEILAAVTRFLGGDPRIEEQIEVVMSMLYGVATMRYVVRLEPLASLPREALVGQLAPLVQERIERMLGV